MLDANGMKMNKKHAQEFFDVLDADKSGGLSIGEFKDLEEAVYIRDQFAMQIHGDVAVTNFEY